MHYERWKKHGDPEVSLKRANGAIYRDPRSGYEYQYKRLVHRIVMEQTLGRPLLPNESVHHINGIRHDNRPENLELMATRGHHAGQRVDDLIAFVVENHTDAVRAALEALVEGGRQYG